MTPAIDLDAYLQRIGWHGPAPRADLPSLRQLAVLHAAAIPFESLNPWLGLPVVLSLQALQDKLVRQRRGGYCFEHNGLLRGVLEQLGFQVIGLGARVVWGLPELVATPRTHRLLQVTVDDAPWLVDVGFGGLTLTGVLRLQADIEQPTAHEPFRLLHHPDDWLGEWHQQARIGETWRTTYRFSLQPQHAFDDELASHYTATHPTSRFVNHLIAARALPDRRLTLLDRDLRIHWLGGASEHRVIADPVALSRVLTEDFGLQLPEHPALSARLNALFPA